MLKALARLPADRYGNAAEFADALARPERFVTASAPAVAATVSPGVASWRHPVVVGSLAIALAALGLAAWTLSRTERATGDAPSVIFDVSHPDADRLTDDPQPLAISPDGQTIAMTVIRDGETRIHTRRLDDIETRPVPGTEGAASLTFTSDGNWIAFSRGTAIFKVPVSGGAPTKVADVPFSRATASWFADGSIIVGSGSSTSLYRLDGGGASLEQVTVADASRGELDHARPQALPDGDHVLFDVRREDGTHAALLTLSSGEWTDLGLGVAEGRVYSAGHLAYRQSSRIVAVGFDLSDARVTGAPVVIDSVGSTSGDPTRIWHIAASPTGTRVHASGPGAPDELDLIWADREGAVTATGLLGNWNQPRLSPDGEQIVAATRKGLYLIRLRSGGRTRLAPPQAQNPAWAPGGSEVAYGDGADLRPVIPDRGREAAHLGRWWTRTGLVAVRPGAFLSARSRDPDGTHRRWTGIQCRQSGRPVLRRGHDDGRSDRRAGLGRVARRHAVPVHALATGGITVLGSDPDELPRRRGAVRSIVDLVDPLVATRVEQSPGSAAARAVGHWVNRV